MDPDAALSEARKNAAELVAAYASGDDDVALEAAESLAGSFIALDEWLSKQGFLPEAWRTSLVPAFGVNRHVDQMLWDVFVVALEGGINDWAATTDWHESKDNGTIGGAEDHEGFYADIIDADYDKGDPDAEFPPTRIDRAVMAKAFERVVAGPIEGWHESYRNKFLVMLHSRLAGMDDSPVDSNYDAYDAQGLVQVGLFGKVIFG